MSNRGRSFNSDKKGKTPTNHDTNQISNKGRPINLGKMKDGSINAAKSFRARMQKDSNSDDSRSRSRGRNLNMTKEIFDGWVMPKIKISKTGTAFFSAYVTVQVEPSTKFVLQRLKKTKLKSESHRAECRIITGTKYPYYEVAFRDNFDELLKNEWSYVVDELPKLLPYLRGEDDKERWLLNHVRKLARQKNTINKNDDTPGDGWALQADQNLNSNANDRKKAMKEKQLRLRLKDYTEVKQIKVYCITWNMNGKKPGQETSDFSDLLIPKHRGQKESPDIYVIGIQEIVDLNTQSMLLSKSSKVDPAVWRRWDNIIGNILKKHMPKKNFTLLKQIQLVGLSIAVYVNQELDPENCISDIQTDSIGVGLMGVGGNKGAVCVRFNIYDSSVCFVNAHLAAHQYYVNQRNDDFHNICRRAAFTDTRTNEKTRSLFHHDTVFWIGDLNYRIDLSNFEHVCQRISVRDWAYLLNHDQLNLEKLAGRAFTHFNEGPIQFAPTYKYQPWTNKYENREGKKIRCPAWTDRIQWMGNDVTQLSYERFETLVSDHKPVASLFVLDTRLVVLKKKTALLKQLNQLTIDQLIPNIKLLQTDIDFGEVYFGEKKVQKIQIKNVGQVVASYSFIGPLKKAIKPWLQIEPQQGTIEPGTSCVVVFMVDVSSETSQLLNMGIDSISGHFFLQVEDSDDHKINIKGRYCPSSFGTDLHDLNRLGPPIRSFTFNQLRQISDAPMVSLIPKEVFRLVDHIIHKISGEETTPAAKNDQLHFVIALSFSQDMLSTHLRIRRRTSLTSIPMGSNSEAAFFVRSHYKHLRDIRDCLDSGKQFPTSLPLAAFSITLVTFLRNLAKPLFDPSEIIIPFNQSCETLTPWCSMALMGMKEDNYQLFIYIISFIRYLIKEKARLGSRFPQDIKELSYVFGQALTHALPTATFNEYQHRSPEAITHYFMTTKDFSNSDQIM